jgi:hypothetical protein
MAGDAREERGKDKEVARRLGQQKSPLVGDSS